jgi:hypothetical protein
MDLFLQSILICALVVNLFATAFFVYKVLRMEDLLVKLERDFHVEMNCWHENFGCTDDKIDSVAYETTKSLAKLNEVIEKIDKVATDSIESFASLKELPEFTKPTKPNNWDSMKKAFTGPIRVEDDVRN